jgi:2,3-bisphosphoglycerate-independent phosphoglycerate mutase
MKYVVVVGDGMADYPMAELGEKTPLEAAHTPNMDFMASHGDGGLVRTIPPGMAPGSEVATLSILGYDPLQYYTGRAPLEAASIGVKIAPGEIGYRCNLITHEQGLVKDYSAGHITSEEARVLIEDIDQRLGTDAIRFYPGISYRHLMVIKNTGAAAQAFPPHDIMGRPVDTHLPSGPAGEVIKKLMLDSQELLAGHPVNKKRMAQGKNPATMIWLWGGGTATRLPALQEQFGVTGAVISAVDLIKGIGILAGCQIISVPGITGYLDTNYTGKAEYALRALHDVDFVFIHVEAPDEASHNGKLQDKLQAIEAVDQKVLGILLSGIKEFKDYKIMILPDHRTPLSLRTHTAEPVPFAIYSSRQKQAGPMQAFSEKAARKGTFQIEHGHTLLREFINL